MMCLLPQDRRKNIYALYLYPNLYLNNIKYPGPGLLLSILSSRLLNSQAKKF